MLLLVAFAFVPSLSGKKSRQQCRCQREEWRQQPVPSLDAARARR